MAALAVGAICGKLAKNLRLLLGRFRRYRVR